MFSSLLLLLAGTALAAPAGELVERQSQAQVRCGQYDTISSPPYTIYTNLWGRDAGTGGQCLTLNSNTNGNVAWSTNWTWSGGPYNVKSYANVGLNMSPAQLSTIKSIPTSWSWRYTGQNQIANVAYDVFTSSQPGGNAEFEIMIWLAALGGAGPISATGSPIATPNVGGTTWKLFQGQNGNFQVYSFVANSQQTNFNGDVKAFFNYLVQSQGFKTSQYVNSVQAGTEPFTGTAATLTTTKYSVSLQK